MKKVKKKMKGGWCGLCSNRNDREEINNKYQKRRHFHIYENKLMSKDSTKLVSKYRWVRSPVLVCL